MPRELTAWIRKLLDDPELRRMGHAQRLDDLNLGLGWVYYGLARATQPKRIVVIGSYRGFAPLVFARALTDNGEDGRVTFIDPSLVDDFWCDPDRVQAHFAAYGIDNIDHFCMTTQQFAQSAELSELGAIGILFVDGYHTEEQARFDHQTFVHQLGSGGYALFHDAVRDRLTNIYGPDKPYRHTVHHYIDTLRSDPAWEVLTLPSGSGLCLVRSAEALS